MKSSMRLHDIRLDMRVGHLAEERAEPQAMRIDIDVVFNEPPRAFDTDELDDSVCYDELIATIKAYCDANEFKLLEHLSKHLHTLIQSNFNEKDKVLVRVTKLNPPIAVLHGGAACSYGEEVAC